MELPLDVLLVDADEDSRALYAEYLAWRGMAVDTAAAPEDALARARAAKAVVVGVSLRTPYDALALIGALRSQNPGKPIVVITASVTPQDRERAAAAGADVFLTKPCIPECLAKHLERLLAAAAPTPRDMQPSPAGECINPQHQRKELYDLHSPRRRHSR